MAILRDMNGTVARFLVNDGQGNEAIGHFEFTVVPSFEPGSRVGDLTFIIEQKVKSATPQQSPEELIQQARLGGAVIGS
jgi:hypothetical protein